MRYGWRGIGLFSPDASGGGGGAPSSDPLTGGTSGDSGGESASSGSPPDGAETGGEDYADLAGDDRVQAYLKAQTEKQFGHIPADHRTPEAYQRLQQQLQEAESIRSNPQWRAFQAAQQAGSQQQQAEEAFHTSILAELEKDLGSPMNQVQKRFFGGMLDRVAKAMEQRFVQQHVDPLKNYLVRQFLDNERSQAERLPDYKRHEKEILDHVQRYGIPYAEAYHMVRGKRIKQETANAGEAAQATGGEEREDASRSRSSDGERPSGATSAGHRMPAKMKPGEGRNGAAAYLRSHGIQVGE